MASSSVEPRLEFATEDLKRLLEPRDPPCVSIYMPTHRRKMEGRSDVILFRNLCRESERVLEKDVPGVVAREIVERLKALDQEEFWDEGPRRDGLAFFVAQGFSIAYRLPGQFPELNVVGGSFHTKPLIRFLQSNAVAYHLLALNAHRVALYEGHGDSIHELPLPGIPQVPGTENGTEMEAGAPDRMRFGQGGPKDQAKVDLEKHFRNVAREIWKGSLRASSRPMILAAPGQLQSVFRRVAQISALIEEGVVVDPAKLSLDELRTEARRVLEPEIQRRIGKVRDEFSLAQSKKHGSDALKLVARAVVEGRVKTLLVESGRRIWGLLDAASGDILPGDSSRNAHDVDLLDELAELSLSRGGEVYVLKKDEMPTQQGIAAVFRF